MATLYDQSNYNSAGANIVNQVFEPANTAFTSYTFIDFTVPAGGWTIDQVKVWVIFSPGSETPTFPNATLLIANDSAGQPDVGTLFYNASHVAGYTDLGFGTGPNSANKILEVSCAGLSIPITPGIYHISLAPEQSFTPNSTQTYALATLTGYGLNSWWWNPGSGFGFGSSPVTDFTVIGSSNDYTYLIAGAVGDPHFLGFDNIQFAYHGEGQDLEQFILYEDAHTIIIAEFIKDAARTDLYPALSGTTWINKLTISTTSPTIATYVYERDVMDNFTQDFVPVFTNLGMSRGIPNEFNYVIGDVRGAATVNIHNGKVIVTTMTFDNLIPHLNLTFQLLVRPPEANGIVGQTLKPVEDRVANSTFQVI